MENSGYATGSAKNKVPDDFTFRWFENLKTDIDWEYYTEPQDNACLSFEGNVSKFFFSKFK